jgi:anti-anti-sigma regulatory factor
MIEFRKFFQILEIQSENDTLIVIPRGGSLGIRDSELRKELNILHKLFDKPEHVNLVVDLGRSPEFGATMVGAIITLGVNVRDHGGRAVMCNASEDVRKALLIMRVDKLLPYFNSREEALKSLHS